MMGLDRHIWIAYWASDRLINKSEVPVEWGLCMVCLNRLKMLRYVGHQRVLDVVA